MANEVELKLRIKTADLQRLRQHPAVRHALVGKPVTRRLISIYYDTPELTLLDAGISLITLLSAAALWVLADLGLFSAFDPTMIVMIAVATVLAIGVSWSHIRQRLSGQVDSNDVSLY